MVQTWRTFSVRSLTNASLAEPPTTTGTEVTVGTEVSLGIGVGLDVAAAVGVGSEVSVGAGARLGEANAPAGTVGED
jgi:hypothetical protein